MNIKEIYDKSQKKEITGSILKSLPNWFGMPESTQEYINESSNLPFFVAIDGSKPIGLISVKENNRYTAEIYVIGVYLIIINKELVKLCSIGFYNGLKKMDMNSYR